MKIIRDGDFRWRIAAVSWTVEKPGSQAKISDERGASNTVSQL